ncbi:MAG: hypothetical protein COV46_05260 [Deltaproteobacteria bacterium CG11_big_fil_rev_8_21_14_0_20_49_13]|nr:MAG: hypothetical protein COV46_05260 [Deltaproteobacteria bacterium CG11_big_fil_rev_8_21_14_0_20_49_13]
MQNIHPLFVHFPIALLIFSVACDILGRLFKKGSLENAGWWSLFFGMIAIAAAATTGLLAASSAPHLDAAHEIMEDHERLQLIAGAIFLILFIIRIVNRTRLPQMRLMLVSYIVLSLIGVGIISFGAHLGGRLVYEYGVGTNIIGENIQHDIHDGEHHHHNDTGEPSHGD